MDEHRYLYEQRNEVDELEAAMKLADNINQRNPDSWTPTERAVSYLAWCVGNQ